jgi:peptide/nickel transport system substrate-binding protein
MQYRFLIYFIFLTATSLAISSCKEDSRKEDTTLDVRISKEPEWLNPLLLNTIVTREVGQYIFLPLADYNPQSLKLEPVLIETIPDPEKVQVDGKSMISFTFNIKKEAKWDNGEPITSADYVFTMKTIMHPGINPSPYRELVNTVHDIKTYAEEPRKVTVLFKEYFAMAPESVVGIEILPKYIYDNKATLDSIPFKSFLSVKSIAIALAQHKRANDFAVDFTSIEKKFTVSGAGPYYIEKWNTNQNILLAKKTNYWAEKSEARSSTEAIPTKINLHIIPDEMAATSRLLNGELDFLSGLNLQSFKNIPDASFSKTTPIILKYYSILLNQGHPIIKSKNVRKALAHICDVDRYIEVFEGGTAVRIMGPISPLKKDAYNKNLQPYLFSVDSAKAYLVRDGWIDKDNNGIREKKINGSSVEMKIPLYFSGELGRKIALFLQNDAKSIGMVIEPIQKEFAQIRKNNIETGDYAMVLTSTVQSLGLDELSSKFHSENATPGGTNFMYYKNAKVDILVNKINREANPDIRNDLYKQVQNILHDELPLLFLYAPEERMVSSAKWKAYTNSKSPGYQGNLFNYKK